MQTTRIVPFRCPSCGQPTTVTVSVIIDPAHNPQQKSQLIAGQLNLVQCPNCNSVSPAPTPLVYHDSEKDLLIEFVPMGLAMSQSETDKFLGSLTREVTTSLQGKIVKGYLLQPRRALTLQGLIEQVLEGDGVTREMLDQQKERSRVIQLLLQSEPEQLQALVEEHDGKIDGTFFQTMNLIAERYANEGRMQLAEHVLVVQEYVANYSTAGKALLERTREQEAIIQEVATQLQTLGEEPSQAAMLALVKRYAGSEDHLQALVGLARPLFDAEFFQAFTLEIGKASAADRPALEQAHMQLQQLIQVIDQENQARLQAAANFLQQVLQHPDPEGVIRANIQMFDQVVMTVLDLNIQQAQQQGNVAASSRLGALRQQIVSAIQEQMHPEMRFINELLSASSEQVAHQLLRTRAHEFDQTLLETLDALVQEVTSQGQARLAVHLQQLRDIAAPLVRQ
jgi:hypothetical protein